MSAPAMELTVWGNECEELRLSVVGFKGNTYIHLRVWGRSTSGRYAGKLFPTRRGLTFKPSQLPALLEAMGAASSFVDAELDR